ncbi:MAG: hypothetical protein LIO75_05385 [Lachnospiraceae bacterium]|nr:hypothetical protein [Lachnospiraceae bacterium]
MIRDFSENAKNELRELVSRVEDEKLCDFTDWVGDRWYDFEEWIGALSLREGLENVNRYHRKVIDKNNMTLAQLESIFNQVAAVESEYHRRLSQTIEICRALNQLLLTCNDIILPGSGGNMTAGSIHALLQGAFGAYAALFRTTVRWDTSLEDLLEEYKKKGTVTSEEMDAYIRLFEIYYAEYTDRLESLLDGLSEDQLREVKYILYTSDEPYRSIYLAELESYRMGNLSGDDTGYFSSLMNTVNVDMSQEETNPRGAFTTFYHECGHAIDYNYQDDGTYFSLSWRNEEGKSLQDVIYEDVRNDIVQTVARYTANEEAQQILTEYIMGAGNVSLDSLSAAEKKLLENIQQYYKTEMAGAVNEACSDVYGGVTNNIIHGSYGHWSDTYWYSANKTATGAQSKELWAEYYSYCITGNEEALARLRDHFPTAAEFLDEMAASMIQ